MDSAGDKHMRSFQIESYAYQIPFTGYSLGSSQRELAKPHYLFDDAYYRLYCTFSEPIDAHAYFGSKLVCHLGYRISIILWRFGIGEKVFPALVVRFSSCSNIGIDIHSLNPGDVINAEMAVIQGGCTEFTYLIGDGSKRGDSLPCIISMIGYGIGYNEKAILIDCNLRIVVLIKSGVVSEIDSTSANTGIPLTAETQRRKEITEKP